MFWWLLGIVITVLERGVLRLRRSGAPDAVSRLLRCNGMVVWSTRKKNKGIYVFCVDETWGLYLIRNEHFLEHKSNKLYLIYFWSFFHICLGYCLYSYTCPAACGVLLWAACLIRALSGPTNWRPHYGFFLFFGWNITVGLKY